MFWDVILKCVPVGIWILVDRVTGVSVMRLKDAGRVGFLV